MNIDFNSTELPMSISDSNLSVITSRLRYAPRSGQGVDPDIAEARDVLIVDPSRLGGCPGAKLLLDSMGKGLLVIENLVNKKSLYSNRVYAIAKPQAGSCTPQRWFFSQPDEVTNILQQGFSIGTERDGLFFSIFGPEDAATNTFRYDQTEQWNKLVAAVVSIDIETDSDWTTDGYLRERLTHLIGKDVITVPPGIDFIDEHQMPVDEFAYDFLTRKLETLMSMVFGFTVKEPAAFYHATAHPRGVCVTRYKDVRAFLWHFQTMERQRCEEQALEEGRV